MRRHLGVFSLLVGMSVCSLSMSSAGARSSPGEPAQPRAIPEWRIRGLVAALGDPDPEVQMLALTTLVELDAVQHPLVAAQRYQQLAVVDALMQSDEPSLVKGALDFLGALGRDGAVRLDAVLALADHQNIAVRSAAIRALGGLGETGHRVTSVLIQAFRDDDRAVQRSAVEAMGALSKSHRAMYTTILLHPIRGDSALERANAARALGLMAHTNAAVPRILLRALRRDENAMVRCEVAAALGTLGKNQEAALDALLWVLFDDDWQSRRCAAEALGTLGSSDQAVFDALLIALLDDTAEVRRSAADALGKLGKSHPAAVAALFQALRDDFADARSSVAVALGELGRSEPIVRDALLLALGDEHPAVARRAAAALVELGSSEPGVIAALVELVRDDLPALRDATGRALPRSGPYSLDTTLSILAGAPVDRARQARVRLSAYQGAGEQTVGHGPVKLTALIRCLALPDDLDYSMTSCVHTARPEPMLDALAHAWDRTPERARHLHDDMAGMVVLLASQRPWSNAHLAMWKSWRERLSGAGFPAHTRGVAGIIADIERRESGPNWSRAVVFALGGHALLWILLLLIYPHSRAVQAIFFWNSWVRRILGLGYVGFVLARVPWLRAYLLRPFDRALRASAELDALTGYYSELTVVPVDSADGARCGPIAIDDAIPRLSGQIVLEGECGQGKSMFLRHLLRGSRRVSVFLPAWRCQGGVIEAVQAMLPGHVRDAGYLGTLICSGGMDMYIDGLSEVDAGTREGIVAFADRFAGVAMLMATRPIAWTPPSAAQCYRLAPLAGDRIRDFLHSRQEFLTDAARRRGDEFIEACDHYLDGVLDNPEELARPMALDIVADLLAVSVEPDLTVLQAQRYRCMADEYQRIYRDRMFPRDELAGEAYRMRVTDRRVIDKARFRAELACMEGFKMVVRRRAGARDGDYEFRCDEIQDFFIAHLFAGSGGEDERLAHLGDPRFRGVYLLMARSWPCDQLMGLREQIRVHARQAGDSGLFDEFDAICARRFTAALGASRF